MRRLLTFMCCTFMLSATLRAQEEFAPAEPTAEHQWLQKFVGEWETEMEAMAGPDQESFTCQGTLKAHMLGEMWLVSEMVSEIPGMPMRGLLTVGYQPEQKQYIGTWVDSFSTHLWRYTGSVDESGKTLSLEAKGPNPMAPGETLLFRDSYEFENDDHIIIRSAMQTEDGEWVPFMTGHARRTGEKAK